MAPSRALLIQRMASACTRPQIPMRAGARLFSSPAAPAAVARPRCMRAAVTPRFRNTPATTRAYSAPADGAPEPPDFLNEAELHIFNKIRGELEPTKLEVRVREIALAAVKGGLRNERVCRTVYAEFC